MPRDASPLELTYESFEQFWKALVSKRKARKLDVDVASAWRQLSEGGAGAAFLRLHAESKAAKAERKHAAATGEPDAPQPVGTRKDPNSARPAAVTKRAAGKDPRRHRAPPAQESDRALMPQSQNGFFFANRFHFGPSLRFSVRSRASA